MSIVMETTHLYSMLRIVDSLKDEFPQIGIVDEDKNGKQYVNTRWLFPKDRDRYSNVFIEIWGRPKADRIDFILPRTIMTPEENREAVLDGNRRLGNTKRGMLPRNGMTEQELYDFVKNKIEKYLNAENEKDFPILPKGCGRRKHR